MTEPEPDRDLGAQPLGELLARHGLTPHDLVAASKVQLTHKMVARATKGRRLTRNTAGKVLAALQAATGVDYTMGDAFSYEPG